MRKIILFLAMLIVPALLFLNVYQVYEYQRLYDVVKAKEQTQIEIIEVNKKIIAGIAYLTSPERIEAIAKQQLGLEFNPDVKSIFINVE